MLVNAEAERMFGYTRGELFGKSIDTLVPDEVRPRHDHHLTSYTSAPRLRPMGSNLDLRGRRKDGTEFPVEISLSPIESEQGLLIIARHSRHDRASEARTREQARERVSRVGGRCRAGRVHAVRRARSRDDGEQRCAPVARRVARRRDRRPAFDELLRESLATGVFDFSNETRESLYRRWLAYHRAPSGTLEVRTGTGRYLRVSERRTADHGTVSTIADVTDDVERTEELGHAREVAEAASAAKSEFLSSMSHELRTPLNAILGFAQLLERDRKQPLTERQLERLGHVMRGGEHLLRLIDDVLDLSRIEAGRVAISAEPVGVAEVLNEVAHTLEPMANRAQIELSIPSTPADLPRVIADRTRLSQILMNFGSNAIKYGKPNGHVSFRTEVGESAVRVTVVDDGIGIPDDKRDKVFEPFQRAGQEAGPIEGTGIGLTISKRLAEMMRATVGFVSEVGRGSEFWIDLRNPRRSRGRGSTRAGTAFAALAIGAKLGAPHDCLYRRQSVEHRVHARFRRGSRPST